MDLKLKDLLRKLNYPNINVIKSEEQITELFKADNRFFFLTWLAKQTNCVYTIPSKWSVEAEKELASFIYQSGFCTLAQKDGFVKADATLKLKDQKLIFERIFNFLTHAVETDVDDFKAPVIEERINGIQEYLATSNLFPLYGTLKLRNHKEILKRDEHCQKAIENLKNDLKTSKYKDDVNEMDVNVTIIPNNKMNENAEKLDQIIIDFQKISSKIINKPREAQIVTPNWENLQACNQETKSFLKHMSNTNIILDNLWSKPIAIPYSEEQNIIFNILRELSSISSQM